MPENPSVADSNAAKSGRSSCLVVAAIVIVVLIGGGIAAAVYWPREPIAPPKRSALEGKLNVAIGKMSGKTRKMVPIEDPDALPVKAGDMMYLQAEYAEPAHTFIIWLDANGKVVPLYPWNFDELEQRDLEKPPPACQAVRVIMNPMTIGKGWKFGKGSGLETLVLLSRRAPDGEKIAFDKLLGTEAPALKIRDRAELGIFQLDKGSSAIQILESKNRGNDAEAKEADRALLTLMERLGAEFDLIYAVRFAHVDD